MLYPPLLLSILSYMFSIFQCAVDSTVSDFCSMIYGTTTNAVGTEYGPFILLYPHDAAVVFQTSINQFPVIFCSEPTGPKQQRLSDVVVRHGKCSKEKTQIINDMVLAIIVNGQRPISIVEDVAVVALLAYLELGYTCPGRTYYTTAIEAKYKQVCEKLSSLLSNACYLSITTDTWTSLAAESYLTITVHYLSDDWVLKSRVLGTMQLDGRHTSANLQQWILDMVNKFGIDSSKNSSSCPRQRHQYGVHDGVSENVAWLGINTLLCPHAAACSECSPESK